ncbi:MAG TPA: hypothetical protein VF746_19205 [Longimicrobium sp.]|jgi:hypothetical protein
MRPAILAALLPLLAAPALAQEPLTAVADSLEGPVRAVRVLRPLDSGVQELAPAYAVWYDRAGRRTEMVHYEKGEPRERQVYTYDARGRHTGHEEYWSPSGPLPPEPRRHLYVLDEEGRRTEYRVLGRDGSLQDRFAFAYDRAGRLREELFFTHRGELSSRSVYDYDARGNRVLWESYDRNGVRAGRRETRYDAAGRKVEEVVYQGGAAPRWRIEYRYDGEGRLAERETHDLAPNPSGPAASHDPEPGKVVYTYRDGGRTVETATYAPDGTLTGRVVQRRDGRGSSERVEYRPDGTLVPVRHYDAARRRVVEVPGKLVGRTEYDARGNWTRQTSTLVPADGGAPIPLWVQVREITYW